MAFSEFWALGEDVESRSDVRLTTWTRCRTVIYKLIHCEKFLAALARDLEHALSAVGCQDDQRMLLMRRIFSYFRNPVSLYH